LIFLYFGYIHYFIHDELKKNTIMKRLAFKMKLKPGFAAEYEKRHNEIWPELKKLLYDAGVRDYSIFLDKETNILFAVQKVVGDSGSQDLGKTAIVQKWWKHMADIMDTNPDNSPVSIPLEEVFHID
jgi:L-rhamnose mutarotase